MRFIYLALLIPVLAFSGGHSEMASRVAEPVYTAAQLPPFTRDAQLNSVDVKAWAVSLDSDQWERGSIYLKSGSDISDVWELTVYTDEVPDYDLYDENLQAAVRTIPGFEDASVIVITPYTSMIVTIPYTDEAVPLDLQYSSGSGLEADLVTPIAVSVSHTGAETPAALANLMLINYFGYSGWDTLGGDQSACQYTNCLTDPPVPAAQVSSCQNACGLLIDPTP